MNLLVNNKYLSPQKLLFVLMVFFISNVQYVNATLMSFAGGVQLISPPVSVELEELRDNNTIYVFEEKQGVTYSGFDDLVHTPLAFEQDLNFLDAYFNTNTFPDFLATQTGLVDESADLIFGSPSIGTKMDSYFVHFEPFANPLLPSNAVSGSLRFDSEILGVQIEAGDYPAAMELSTQLFELEDTEYYRFYAPPPPAMVGCLSFRETKT